MKVLFINTLYAPLIIGGAERSVQLLAEGIMQRGHEASVATLVPKRYARRGQVNDATVHYQELKNVYWPFEGEHSTAAKYMWHLRDTYNSAAAEGIAEVLEMERPDVVHTNNLGGFSVSVWSTIKRARYPLVHTIRDYYLLCPRTSMFRRGRECARQCADCWALSYAKCQATAQVDVVVGISRYVLQRHLDAGCFEKSRDQIVIYNPYLPVAETATPRSVGDPLRFGFLGRLSPEKGIELLIDACLQLPHRGWRLLIGGTGETSYVEGLRKRAAGAPIEFLGFVPPTDLFKIIDVLVVPSLWNEPLGRVALESLAFGCPVVASRKGGLPEIVTHGETGFLFDPAIDRSLIDVLSQILATPARIEAMQPNCREAARAYAPDKIVESYLQIYRSLKP